MDGAEQDKDGEQSISNTHIHTQKKDNCRNRSRAAAAKSSQLLLWLTEEHTEHASLGVTDRGGEMTSPLKTTQSE